MSNCPSCGAFLMDGVAHTCRPAQRKAPNKCPTCNAVILFGKHACKGAPPQPKVADPKASLTELYLRNSGGTWPMDRLAADYVALVKRLNGTGGLYCSEDNLKRLATALCYVEKEGLLATTLANGWTIKGFMGLTEGFQIQIIDKLWNECTVPKTYGRKFADMEETDAAVTAGDEQLPSSVHPNPQGGGLPFVKGPASLPFGRLGIGFRVDGTLNGASAVSSISRIQKEGMTAQVLNAWFMESVRHMMVKQTTIALNTSAPRIYVRAQDLFNETAVCISRSFFGATAFPERETNDTACLWAVDTTGLTGFDTEKHQIDEKAHPWRPGEKCVERVPAKNVLGYVLFERMGVGDASGWKFRVPKGATWTYLNMPNTDKKLYCDGELAAWADGVARSIPGQYDFVN